MGKDYYNVLQITRSAKDAEIKQAYRKLALNYHPLKNPSDKSIAEKFNKPISEIDKILNNNLIN
jgi:DnaJ-class molecular chaperone